MGQCGAIGGGPRRAAASITRYSLAATRRSTNCKAYPERCPASTLPPLLSAVMSHQITTVEKTTPRARGGVTMAPLQLRLEPTEVVSTTDSGAARVRVDSTDESSLQV
eukprot:scaffold3614_cov123-Isochrysis_galbana.AAC.12